MAETSKITDRVPYWHIRNVHCLYVAQWHFTRLVRPRCYNLTCAIPVQSSTNWAIKPSKSWLFCEFVILFSRRFATWLRRSILLPPTRKKPLAPRTVVDDDQFKWIFERPYTQLGFESPVQAWIFFATTLVVCRTTMINHIYSFIFIPLSFLFLSFYLSIFQITFLSFLFF